MENPAGPGSRAEGPETLLCVEHLSKRFPLVQANDDISFDARKGEIHCLLGENGAGKSTLAEILYGTHRPDSGAVYLRGQRMAFSSPRDAIRAGIGMVHQHFVLIPTMSVLENIVIGTQSTGVWFDPGPAMHDIHELCAAYGVEIDLHAKVSDLCLGEQQWVEILKALYVGAELLMLDEPTAVLTPQEVAKLFAILKKMRARNLSVILITHKLDEVMEISDRVTVLRKGRVVETVSSAAVTKGDLARMMVGRDVVFQIERGNTPVGDTLLVVEGLMGQSSSGCEALAGVSFALHRSEILGLAGVSGNGQRELVDVLVGMRKATGGRVRLNGQDITNRSLHYVASLGLALVPEDRIQQGLVMDFRIDENLILGRHRERRFAQGPFLSSRSIASFAEKLVKDFSIAAASARQATRGLSGGNLQKVILAREFAQAPECLIVCQPTRGLDVGATEYVRRQLLERRDRGAGILLISEDLDEIFNLSTRIAVIFRGQIVGIVETETATVQDIGLMMAGCGAEPQ